MVAFSIINNPMPKPNVTNQASKCSLGYRMIASISVISAKGSFKISQELKRKKRPR